MKKTNKIHPLLKPVNSVRTPKIKIKHDDENDLNFSPLVFNNKPRKDKDLKPALFINSPDFKDNKRPLKNMPDGFDDRHVNKIASEKPITLANLDRWKRTFGYVKNKQDTEAEENESSVSPASSLGGSKGKRSSTDGETVRDDVFDEDPIHADSEGGWGVIHPDSIFRSIWEICGFSFLIIQSLMTPFKLAFDINSTGPLEIFEIIMDFFFILDICIFYFKGNMLKKLCVLIQDFIRKEIWLCNVAKLHGIILLDG